MKKVIRKYQYYDILDHTWYWIELAFKEDNLNKPIRIILDYNNCCSSYYHSTMVFNTSRDSVCMISRNKWNMYLNQVLTILELIGVDIKNLDMSYLYYRKKSFLRRVKEFFQFETISNLIDRKMIYGY